jgi:hypothetical protein
MIVGFIILDKLIRTVEEVKDKGSHRNRKRVKEMS